ncbi:MAG: antitermination protein NusB [Candidatus Levybacteria bacterium]|nr:antitermination protein NusB [Candidatus Levybacteria bacterium]
MKTFFDPRHRRRQKLVEELFKNDFHKQSTSIFAEKILSFTSILDEAIRDAAKQFPIDKINKIDLAILRLAVFELIIDKKEPPKVIVDEAIELAKEYGGEASPSFINGALGNILSNEKSS